MHEEYEYEFGDGDEFENYFLSILTRSCYRRLS
jgi:hypothetical protein